MNSCSVKCLCHISGGWNSWAFRSYESLACAKNVCLVTSYTSHEQQLEAVANQKMFISLGDAPCLVKVIHLSLATSGTSNLTGSPGLPVTKLAWPEPMPVIFCSSWLVMTTAPPGKEKRSGDNQVSRVFCCFTHYWLLHHKANKHPQYFISIQLFCNNMFSLSWP